MSPPTEEADVWASELPSRFMKTYNNLPMKEREQTVVVLEDEPVSWKMAKREVTEETDLGADILKKLDSLDII
ncbi:MAG: hypothetical protein MUP63_01455 [Candidatus Nanohaloarchaeota archaeon QJJ-7]|nr:hypothetical protein [Candidatus Nanohaloarchaeota archaeon QJJ-7]